VAAVEHSFTGQFLRDVLGLKKAPRAETPDGAMAITPEGLKALRVRLGLSQAEAAHVAGVSRGLLAEAERGRRAGERTLARIALGLRTLVPA
jgi:DNA-binding XRE family transcriptional regulator